MNCRITLLTFLTLSYTLYISYKYAYIRSVITVQRAYEDLTRDGFIETVSGKGSFVASPNKEFIQEEQLRIAEELLEKVAIIGRTHGISYEQMANILKLFFEE